jgi:hypothetical protein
MSGLWSYVHGDTFDSTKTYWTDISGNSNHLYLTSGSMPTKATQTRSSKTFSYVQAPNTVGMQYSTMRVTQPAQHTIFHFTR